MRWLLVLASVGCGGEQWEARERTDSGDVCVQGQDGGTATVTVLLDECMSSSCDRAEQGTCSATLDGTTITVTSTFTWETATGNVECTDDCGMVTADCTVGPLAAGTYTVVLGSEQQTVTIPNDDCGL